jgi:hypothetical protein
MRWVGVGPWVDSESRYDVDPWMGKRDIVASAASYSSSCQFCSRFWYLFSLLWASYFKKNDSTDLLDHQGSWDTTVWCYSISHAVEINSDFFSFLFIQVYGIYCICFFINLNKQTVNCWSCVVGAFFLVCVQKEYELYYSFVSQPLNYELLTFLFAILCDCMLWQALLKPQVTATVGDGKPAAHRRHHANAVHRRQPGRRRSYATLAHRPCRRRLGSGECCLGCGRTILGCLEALLQPSCCCRRGWLIHLEIYEHVQKTMQWYTHNIARDIACMQRWVRNMRTLLLLAAMLSGVQGNWIKRKRPLVALSRTNQLPMCVYIYIIMYIICCYICDLYICVLLTRPDAR